VSLGAGDGDVATNLHHLAAGQAALRRIAAVAAAGNPPETVFGTVTAEASILLGGALVALTRFERSGAEAVVLAQTGGHVAVGVRLPVTGDTTLARLWRSGRAERMDGYVGGRGTQLIEQLGVRAGVSVPVTVHGDLWGALGVSSLTGPLPAGTEHRLAVFVEIIAAAVVSTEARESARVLADEQAALLRVAALVAHSATEAEIFDAVAVEAAGLVDDEPTTLVRYEGGRTFTVLAHCNGPAPVGMTFTVPADDAGTLDQMLRTLKPARLDHYDAIADRSFSNREFGVGSSVSIPIVVDGRLWGSLGTLNEGRRLPAATEGRLAKFAELAAAAIANAENKAKLRASRARIVATADETRQRLQRDVHDGAQQRLVQTVLTLKLCLAAAERGEETTDLMREALQQAERATVELRDIVHGILPASLTRGGLRAGLDSLVAAVATPVDLDLTPQPFERLPGEVEVTAYFVVAEALTNVVKHARATRAQVTVAAEADLLVVEVRDDGVGGADPRGGSGLTGLSDRVDAMNGTLLLKSGGTGTTVRVTLPLPGARAG
jgi:signal transduction histidine kinase